MKPEAKHFTKNSPCSKADLWRCFRRSPKGFATVQVDEAHAVIGKNAPRYMQVKQYLVIDKTPSGDFYRITPLGEQWLITGIKAYVKNHPAEKSKLSFLPGDTVPGRRIRRVR
jgi:hypothetical protein